MGRFAYYQIVIFTLNYYKPLSISKTKKEWEIIQGKISNPTKKSMNVYLRNEINKLILRFNECPKCVSKKRPKKTFVKRPYISIDQYNEIKRIADAMKIQPSTLVDILIIQPLIKR